MLSILSPLNLLCAPHYIRNLCKQVGIPPGRKVDPKGHDIHARQLHPRRQTGLPQDALHGQEADAAARAPALGWRGRNGRHGRYGRHWRHGRNGRHWWHGRDGSSRTSRVWFNGQPVWHDGPEQFRWAQPIYSASNRWPNVPFALRPRRWQWPHEFYELYEPQLHGTWRRALPSRTRITSREGLMRAVWAA